MITEIIFISMLFFNTAIQSQNELPFSNPPYLVYDNCVLKLAKYYNIQIDAAKPGIAVIIDSRNNTKVGVLKICCTETICEIGTISYTETDRSIRETMRCPTTSTGTVTGLMYSANGTSFKKVIRPEGCNRTTNGGRTRRVSTN